MRAGRKSATTRRSVPDSAPYLCVAAEQLTDVCSPLRQCEVAPSRSASQVGLVHVNVGGPFQ